jgi:hypothetical protein
MDGYFMRSFYLKGMIAVILLNLAGISCFSQSNSVAIIKSFTGNVLIKFNNNEIKPVKYLSLASNTTINLNGESNITLILKNGDSVYFNDKANFVIQEKGLVAMDKDTENYIKKNLSNLYAEAKNELKGKNIASSRAVVELPEDLQNEINETANITDPAIKSLAKIDIYKKYLAKAEKEEDKKIEDIMVSYLNREIRNYEKFSK